MTGWPSHGDLGGVVKSELVADEVATVRQAWADTATEGARRIVAGPWYAGDERHTVAYERLETDLTEAGPPGFLRGPIAIGGRR